MEQPWWTPADQAEHEIIMNDWHELQTVHMQHCEICAQWGPHAACSELEDVWQVILRWYDRRHLLSRAVFYRLDEILKGRRP